jgi:hypothetical protein
VFVPRKGAAWRSLALGVLVSLILNLFPARAAGITGNVMAHPTSGSEACGISDWAGISGHTCTSAIDENDATYYQSVDGSTSCSFNGNKCGYQSVMFRWGSAGNTQTLLSFRLKGVFPASGCGDQGCVSGSYTVNITCGGTIRWSITTDATALDTGRINFTTPCYHGDGSSGDININAGFYLPNGHVIVYEFEAYTDEAVTTVPISTYMFNMRVDHPQFQWTASFSWKIGWHGSFVVATSSSAGSYYTADSGGTTLTSSHTYTSYTATAGTVYLPYFHQDCFPLCQSDEFTVIVNDTDRSQTATYTFTRSSDGPVSDPIEIPQFTAWAACYNVAANDCDADFDPSHTHSSGAGTTDITYAFLGSNANVQVGPRSNLNAFTFQTVRSTQMDQTAGTYTYWGLTTSTSQNRDWLFGATNDKGSDYANAVLNFTTGGVTAGGTSSVIGGGQSSSDCGDIDPLCALRQVFNIAAGAVSDLITNDDGTGALDRLHDLALSKQPFNFIVRAYDGISGQIGRAVAAVTSTTDCPGITFSLSSTVLPSTINGYTVWPSGMTRPEFTILRCADFEDLVGSSWYQTVRTVLDPAIYLLWGYSQLRRLQPQTVVAA